MTIRAFIIIVIIVATAFMPHRIRILTGIPKTAICHA
jgi:hypothetical protein